MNLPQTQPKPTIARIQTISRWLDDRFLDPIIGFLLPGLGDLLPALFGLYVVFTAWRERVPAIVIARMLLNIAVDVALGLVPVVGDLIDIGYRAHQRNAKLLVARHERGGNSAGDWLLVVGAGVAVMALLAAPVVLMVLAASAVAGW